MGERSSHVHGTFSWVDNATTDQDGVKSFYSELFGWTYDDQPVGEGIYYSLALLDGRTVAAVAPQQQDEVAQGIPSHWNNYVTVDDVDAIAPRVTELGGQLVVPPFDVISAGRMAVLIDPTGAPLCMWQAGESIGAQLVNTHGSLTWNELGTRDTDAAAAFFGELFGWTFERIPQSPVPYWTIRNGGRMNGGMRLLGDETPADVPAYWLPYFGVDSIDSALERVLAAGGQVLVPKTPTNPPNSFAVISDTSGAVCGLAESEMED